MERRHCIRERLLNQRGMTLVTVLLSLMLLTLPAMTMMAVGTAALGNATREREASEALYIAESGINHARALIFSQPLPSDLDDLLTAEDGTACNGDELSGTPDPPLTAGDAVTTAAAGGHPFGAGRYEVRVCDDHAVESSAPTPDTDPNHDTNSRILVRVTGFGANGSSASLEILVSREPLPVLLIEGNLRIRNNPNFMGEAGKVHTNGNLEIVNNACAEQYFSATGTITGTGRTGSSCNDSPADQRPGQDPIPVPTVDVPSLKPEADYILGNDGIVRDQDGNVLGTSSWNDWTWNGSGRKWIGGDGIPAGTYYAEGCNIEFDGDPGSSGSPFPLTLIAEGWIHLKDDPVTAPDLTLGGVGYAVVAGTDLKIDDKIEAQGGLYYASHQIGFSDNFELNAQVIAKNLGDTIYPPTVGSNLVQLVSGYMEIRQNFTIDTAPGAIGGDPDLIAWRECRGSNPDSPCD